MEAPLENASAQCPLPGIEREVGRVELAKHKHTTIIVGYTATGDEAIAITITGSDGAPLLTAEMSPQSSQALIELLKQSRRERGDD